jgi:hypothetical protein
VWVYCGSFLLVGCQEQLARARREVGALHRLMRERAAERDLTPPLAVIFGEAMLDHDIEALSPFGAARLSITGSFEVNGVWRLCHLGATDAGRMEDGCGLRILLFKTMLKAAARCGAPILFSPAFRERDDADFVQACMARFRDAPSSSVGTPILWAL